MTTMAVYFLRVLVGPFRFGDTSGGPRSPYAPTHLTGVRAGSFSESRQWLGRGPMSIIFSRLVYGYQTLRP
jgi:hypothetical protein